MESGVNSLLVACLPTLKNVRNAQDKWLMLYRSVWSIVEAKKTAANAMEERDRSAADSERAVREARQRVCASRTECSQAETKVLKLGGQVGAAHIELARAMEREAKVREQMDELRQEMDRFRQEVEGVASDMSAKAKSEMHCSVKELKERLRHAERERTKAEAQVMKMGRHVSTAHIEQAKAMELKEQVSTEAKQAAAQMEGESKGSKARVERLGSQMGAALVEAGRASQFAQEARQTIDTLRERLRKQEDEASQEVELLRTLKAQMAERALAKQIRELALLTHCALS
ncbi:MAG: hypothetical protein SGPRY_013726 [Prymnesium sp.]